jgi:transposase
MKQLASPQVIEEVQGKRGRYQRWPEALKRQIVAETCEAGQSVSIVARRHDVNANQVFRWRQVYGGKGARVKEAGTFIPVGIVGSLPMETRPSAGMMTIEVGRDVCVRVDRDVDEGALSRVLAAIRGLS